MLSSQNLTKWTEDFLKPDLHYCFWHAIRKIARVRVHGLYVSMWRHHDVMGAVVRG